MPSWSDRPYRRSSISQLESLFQGAKGDAEALRTLDNELGHRTTERASRLRSMVAEGLAALRVKPAKVVAASVVNDEAPITTRTSAEIEFPKSPARQPPIQSAPVAARAPESAAIPSVEDLGSLPSFPPPKGPNEPMAVLAAWTALEALSPQTYRRPEDLADGDRRCVADLSTGRVPWGVGERSRPKRQLYYQIVLGSIPMEQATEELVKAFGEDEERSRRAREKAAIGVVLVDRRGILVEENGIAASSFAWALPLALKLQLGALGAWPTIEPKIIDKLDGILRRVDADGMPIPLDLPTIDKAHRWLVAQFSLPTHLARSMREQST